jgi:hypothetical protein
MSFQDSKSSGKRRRSNPEYLLTFRRSFMLPQTGFKQSRKVAEFTSHGPLIRTLSFLRSHCTETASYSKSAKNPGVSSLRLLNFVLQIDIP